jgi:signal transduction histidine kinase
MSDLLARLHARSIATELDVEPGLALGTAHEALVFRTAQEALRNVTDHAGARHVGVHLRHRDGGVELEVTDDGRGFVATTDDRPRLGLRMLTDLAEESGGELAVSSLPGSGTTLRLRLPVAL